MLQVQKKKKVQKEKKIEVQFLLNTYCFSTIKRLKNYVEPS